MWWQDLGALRQSMFILGCCAGGILIVQIIMTLIGLGGSSDFDFDGGADTDFDGGSSLDSFNEGGAVGVFGMKMLSIRSIVAFLGVGSWVCFLLLHPAIGWPVWGAVPLAVAAGLVAAVLMAFALYSVEKMQSSGNVSIQNAVGKVADVYLGISAAKAAAGKIQITVQERLRDYDAYTEGSRDIKTGEKVKVVGVIDDTTVLVEPF